MSDIAPYLIALALGVALALVLTNAAEVRRFRLFQIIVIPGIFLALVFLYQASGGKPNLAAGIGIMVLIVFLAFFLAPNFAFYCGVGVTNFLDPLDWTPAEQQLALRPINRLIDKDRFYEALTDLEALLQTHKPTYEALVLHAKLLHRVARTGEIASALLRSLTLTQTSEQQITVMQLLAALPVETSAPRPSRGSRRVRIAHHLVLFRADTVNPSDHKMIPPGEYEIHETMQDGRLWLVLDKENWGNAAICWEAVRQTEQPAPEPARRGNEFLRQIARFEQAISSVFKKKPRLYSRMDADKVFKEAVQLIRQENWAAARPLLEKASQMDPHRYEIAYRWVQSVRRTEGAVAAIATYKKVLDQNQWSPNEREMLEQMARSED